MTHPLTQPIELMPRAIRMWRCTLRALVLRSGVSERSQTMTSREWLAALSARRGPDAVRIVRTVGRHLQGLGNIRWFVSQRGDEREPRLWPGVMIEGRHLMPPIGFRLDGMVEVPFQWMTTAPFSSESARKTLARFLQSIKGVIIPHITGRPSFGLRLLDTKPACERLVEIFRWFTEGTKCTPHGRATVPIGERTPQPGSPTGFRSERVRWKLSFLINSALQSTESNIARFGPLRRWISSGLGIDPSGIRTVRVSKSGDLTRRLSELKLAWQLTLAVVEDPTLVSTVEEEAYAFVGTNHPGEAIAVCTRAGDDPWGMSSVVREPTVTFMQSLELSLKVRVVTPRPPKQKRASDYNRLQTLAERLYVDPNWLREILWLLRDRRGLIFYGPPGTGKTYLALAIAELIQSDAALRQVLQVHPGYDYRSLFDAPDHPNGTGPVLDLMRKMGNTHRGVLVLDELHRVNPGALLGELVFGLEYRNMPLTAACMPNRHFHVPEKLYIVGTMSTAERPEVPIDRTLRRRFHFVSLMPGESVVDDVLRRFLAANHPEFTWLAPVVEEANRRLGDPFIGIGPSHFMRAQLDGRTIERIWKYSVLPMLEDHFMGSRKRLKDFQLTELRSVTRLTEGLSTPPPIVAVVPQPRVATIGEFDRFAT